MSSIERSPRIGLVLGAGGATGHAFHAGVLAALSDSTGWDARDAEIVVGTSAGSLVGALLRAGLSAPDIAARTTDGILSPAGQELMAETDAVLAAQPQFPPRPVRRLRVPVMAAPGAFAHAARRPWRVRPTTLMAAAMPAGRISTGIVVDGVRPLFEEWPEPPLWITAVHLDTGRRVTFGRDASSEADVATAVAASCAIPGFFEPVVIDGVRYVDGGTHSPTNADLLAGLELDLVVVSSPMSIAESALRLSPDQPSRRLSRLALGREVARIRKSGTPVITFQPTAADLAVMGLNAMDASRRVEVTRTVRDSARRRIVRADARDRATILTGSTRLRA
jgi:NTE family protein